MTADARETVPKEKKFLEIWENSCQNNHNKDNI